MYLVFDDPNGDGEYTPHGDGEGGDERGGGFGTSYVLPRHAALFYRGTGLGDGGGVHTAALWGRALPSSLFVFAALQRRIEDVLAG
jgi:hypothetical protein